MLGPAMLQHAPMLVAAVPAATLHAGHHLAAVAARASTVTPGALAAFSTSGPAASAAPTTASGSTSGSSSRARPWQRWLLGAGTGLFAAAVSAGAAGARPASKPLKQQEAAQELDAAQQQDVASGKHGQQAAATPEVAAEEAAEKLPEYTEEEVAQHRTPETRIWVTYRG